MKLLKGYRGKPAGDVEAAIDAVMAIAKFADAHRDRLVELDVNPLMVLPEGQGAVAVDALIVMAGECMPRPAACLFPSPPERGEGRGEGVRARSSWFRVDLQPPSFTCAPIGGATPHPALPRGGEGQGATPPVRRP